MTLKPKARKRIPVGDWERTITFRGKVYYYFSAHYTLGKAKKEAKELLKVGYKIRLVRHLFPLTGIMTGVYTNPRHRRLPTKLD